MIDSKVSGIAFDVNQKEENLYTISANYGLGESVVGGMVNPEMWEIDPRNYEVVRCAIGNKRLEVVPSQKGGTRTIPVGGERRVRFALRDNQAVAMARELKTVGDYYRRQNLCKKYIDTEFALDEHDQLYFVQVRPEVTWSNATDEDMIVTVDQEKSNHDVLLSGGSCGHEGAVTGRLCVADVPIDDKERIAELERKVEPADILVAHATNLNWNPLLIKVGAVITSSGDPNCHAAITSRVLGIPCIVGLEEAVEKLKRFSDTVVTVCAHDLRIFAGEVPLRNIQRRLLKAEARRAIRVIQEDEAEIARKEKESARKRGLLISNSGGDWLRNPPWPYGRFQHEIYVRAFSALSAERLSELIQAYVQLLIYTHMGFNYAVALNHAMAKLEREITDQDLLIVYRAYLEEIVKYEDELSKADPSNVYTELIRQARPWTHLFFQIEENQVKKQNPTTVTETLKREQPALLQSITEFAHNWAETEEDDIRLPAPVEIVVASVQKSLQGEPAIYSYVIKEREPVRPPEFPHALKTLTIAEDLKRLAILYAKVGALKIKQHYLLPRGGWQIRQALCKIGEKLLRRRMLTRAEDCAELTPGELTV